MPAVLLSGHHATIERWRREQSLALTARAPARPDRRGARRRAGSTPADERFLAGLAAGRYNRGLFDPLPRSEPRLPHGVGAIVGRQRLTQQRAGKITRRIP